MAGNEHLVTYLSLSPEFGGTRFGPFEGLEVRLGSNPDRCHIVLPESLGVLPEHIKLIRQGPINLILTPSERTATVFLYRQGEHRPIQLNTPTAVRPGDAFALVTPDGPRFIIEVGELPEEIKAQREGRGGGRRWGGRKIPDADAFKQEGKRQIWTTLLTTGPGQILQRAYTYIVSGAIFQPRNIIMFAMMLLAGGGLGIQRCNINKLRRSHATEVERVASCNQQLGYCTELTSKPISEYTFDELASSVLRSTRIGAALNADQVLRDLVREKAKAIDVNDYEWIRTGQGLQANLFGSWRGALDDKFDPDTTRLLLWAAATPGLGRDEFRVIPDSTGTKVCGRGPLSLTFRQSLRLRISAEPDAYFLGAPSDLESNTTMEELIRTNLAIPGYELEEGGEFDLESLNSTQQCVFREGTDDRNRARQLAAALSRQLGENGSYLPSEDKVWYSIARLAKMYAADIPEIDYNDRDSLTVDFSESHVSQAVKDLGAEGTWVMERTADAIAQAMVLSCYAVLGGESTTVKNLLGEENLPSDIACLILNYKLQNE